jgi:hypothetical protein
MGRFLEVVKSILTWLDRLHPVFKIFLVIAVLFLRSPLVFPPLSVYLIWRWSPALNKLLRIGIVGVSVLVTISWFSGLYYVGSSPKSIPTGTAPEEKLVEKEKEIEEEAVGPPELVDDATYKRLMAQEKLSIEEMAQVLNTSLQGFLILENAISGEMYGGLIGGVHIEQEREGTIPIDFYEQYKDRLNGINWQKKFAQGAYKRIVPQPSCNISAIWSVPNTLPPDHILLDMARIIGRCIQKSNIPVTRFHFLQYREAGISRYDKWEGGNILFGILEAEFCVDVYRAYPTAIPKRGSSGLRAHSGLLAGYAEEQNDAWGETTWSRPRSIQEMIESGKIILAGHGPFSHLASGQSQPSTEKGTEVDKAIEGK